MPVSSSVPATAFTMAPIHGCEVVPAKLQANRSSLQGRRIDLCLWWCLIMGLLSRFSAHGYFGLDNEVSGLADEMLKDSFLSAEKKVQPKTPIFLTARRCISSVWGQYQRTQGMASETRVECVWLTYVSTDLTSSRCSSLQCLPPHWRPLAAWQRLCRPCRGCVRGSESRETAHAARRRGCWLHAA